MARERPALLAQRAAEHLVDRVVAPDVLAHREQLAVRVEEARRVQAAGAREAGLRRREPLRQRREDAAASKRAGSSSGGAPASAFSIVALPQMPQLLLA